MIGIYLIRHKLTGMCYVGQSVNIAQRMRWHSYGYTGNHRYIDLAIKKHGYDAFHYEILELCEEDNLNQREIHWIATLDTIYPNGYNLTIGGKSGRRSIETCRKISKALKGKKKSPEHIKKISDSKRGKKYPPDIRKKMGGRKGFKHTPESIQKMSKSKKEYWERRRHNHNQLSLFP